MQTFNREAKTVSSHVRQPRNQSFQFIRAKLPLAERDIREQRATLIGVARPVAWYRDCHHYHRPKTHADLERFAEWWRCAVGGPIYNQAGADFVLRALLGRACTQTIHRPGPVSGTGRTGLVLATTLMRAKLISFSDPAAARTLGPSFLPSFLFSLRRVCLSLFVGRESAE